MGESREKRSPRLAPDPVASATPPAGEGAHDTPVLHRRPAQAGAQAGTQAENGPPPLTGAERPMALPRPEPDAIADALDKARVEAALFGEQPAPVKIGRFTLLERIGAGGMGEIYAAYDPELDRKVAIKLVKQEKYSPQATDRLHREAQTLARLSHPNVVQIYDVGRHDGRVFLAMEFIRGVTLEQWLARPDEPRSWREILRVLLAAGRGLAAAHGAGLMHRDFKPANVLVGDDGAVRVIDFGLARADEPTSRAHEQSAAWPGHEADESAGAPAGGKAAVALTSTGTILGTPAYMSPEQMDARDTDRRSDQFSFCVVLYEALYKERPYPGNDLGAIRAAMSSGARPSVPRHGSVPAWIDQALVRGLAIAPEQRYPSMEALLAALARDPARRRRQWTAGAALLTAAAVGLGLSWLVLPARTAALDPCASAGQELSSVWNPAIEARVEAAFLATGAPFAATTWQSTRRAIDRYASGWVAERRAACEATHVRRVQTEELLELRALCLDRRAHRLRGLLQAWSEADVPTVEHALSALGELPEVAACADGERLRLGLRPPERAELAARVDELRAQLAQGHARELAGRYDDAIEIADQQVRVAAGLGYPPVHAEALYLAGRLRLLRQRGDDVKDGRARLLEAAELAEGHRHDQLAARIWNALAGLSALDAPDLSLRRGYHARARAAVTRIADRGALRANTVHDQAVLLYLDGRYGEALPHFERAIELLDEAGGDPLGLAIYRQQLGNDLVALGRTERARSAYERAHEALRALLGEHHPRVANASYDLALFLAETGELERARALLEHAAAVWRALDHGHDHDHDHGHDHDHDHGRNLGRVHMALADIEQQTGQLDSAQRHAERALAIYERWEPENHARLMQPVLALSVIEYRRRRFDRALAFGERALALYRQGEPRADDPNLALIENNLGEFLVGLGRHDEALAIFARTEAMLAAAATEHPVLLALPHKGRGLALLGKGAHGPAMASLERALSLFRAHPGYPLELADTAWALARAIRAIQGPAQRALTLAAEARDIYVEQGQSDAAAEIDTWLTR